MPPCSGFSSCNGARARSRAPTSFFSRYWCCSIGLGSLAFHLYATQGTELADVIPIGVFMLVYLGFALNRFLGVPPGFTVLLVIGFTAIMASPCRCNAGQGAIGFPGPEIQGVKACLNGSLFYLPGAGGADRRRLVLMEERQ